MISFFNYIQFLWSSTNAHGIHSPFVYDFYTIGLKNSEIKHSDKLVSTLLKTVAYFKIKTIYFSAKTQYLSSIVSVEQVQAVDKAQLICCSIEESEFISQALSTLKCPIFIKQSHRTTKSIRYWNQLINNQHIDVSIDLFKAGLLFFRPEQKKEHFKLRI